MKPRPARTPKWAVSNKNWIEKQWKSILSQQGPQNVRFLIRIWLKINKNQSPASQGLKTIGCLKLHSSIHVWQIFDGHCLLRIQKSCGGVWEPLRGFGTLWNLWTWKLLGASGGLWETLRAFGNWKNAGNRNKQQEHNTNNVYLRDLFGPTSIVLAAVWLKHCAIAVKAWNHIRRLMTLLPFQMIHNQEHKQPLHHICLSNALESASGGLLSTRSNSQVTAEAEQFGLATVAVNSRRNKLRLGGITWYVFSALRHTVKHVWFRTVQAIVLPNKLLKKGRSWAQAKRKRHLRLIERLNEQEDSSNV